mgnify:CR=1 FL=1
MIFQCAVVCYTACIAQRLVHQAKGDFIAFIDDDDWIEPDYLDFLYQLLVEYDADVSICGTTTASSEKRCVMTAEEAVIGGTILRRPFSLAAA